MMGNPPHIPHKDTLVSFVFTNTKRDISTKVFSMLQTTEMLRECVMTILAVLNLYSRAADRKQQVFTSLNAALSWRDKATATAANATAGASATAFCRCPWAATAASSCSAWRQ